MSGHGPNDRGGRFYDEVGVADEYLAHRYAATASPNLMMEEPAFLRELGSPVGLRVLDLGCGDGAFAAYLLDGGIGTYYGIDGSTAMIQRAQQRITDPRAVFSIGDIEDLAIEASAFDVVTSRMALHYIEDLSSVFMRIRKALNPGDRLLFSVVHPTITAFDNVSDQPRTSWVVDDYFVGGPRQRRWFGSTVTWHHRTIEQYLNAVLSNGFELVALSECEPDQRLLEAAPSELQRRRRVPLVLLVSASAR